MESSDSAYNQNVSVTLSPSSPGAPGGPEGPDSPYHNKIKRDLLEGQKTNMRAHAHFQPQNDSLCFLFHREVRPGHQSLCLPEEKVGIVLVHELKIHIKYTFPLKNSIIKHFWMCQVRYLRSRLSWHTSGTIGSRTTL